MVILYICYSFFVHISKCLTNEKPMCAQGVSSVLVMGGAGDYFGVADCVLRMDCYAASDATAQAKAVDARFGGRDASEDARDFGAVPSRVPQEVYPGHGTGGTTSCCAGAPVSLSGSSRGFILHIMSGHCACAAHAVHLSGAGSAVWLPGCELLWFTAW